MGGEAAAAYLEGCMKNMGMRRAWKVVEGGGRLWKRALPMTAYLEGCMKNMRMRP